MKMKQVMSHNINNGLLKFMQRTYADSYGLSVKIRCRPLLIIVTGYQARCEVIFEHEFHSKTSVFSVP